MLTSTINCRVLNTFDSPDICADTWNALLPFGSTDEIFLTYEWQKTWWEIFGRGRLILVVAENEGKPIAIAPLFADSGMIYFTGSGGSDYLDFIGDISKPGLLEKMLQVAAAQAADFIGFCFYHVPDLSKTTLLLNNCKATLGWDVYLEGEHVAPLMRITADRSHAEQSTRKKSLLRHEAYFKKSGVLEIQHVSCAREIERSLPDLIEQHISRWQETPYPSLFLDEHQRKFYQKVCEAMAGCGWLRFSRVVWNDAVIAQHFGFNYKGSFLWYKPTFDIALSRKSPGEVLLRHLILLALDEEAHTFDFGLGDEFFKKRFATEYRRVCNWGVYPPRD